MADFLLGFVQLRLYMGDPVMQFFQAHGREFGYVLSGNAEMPRNLLQAGSVAFGASSGRHELHGPFLGAGQSFFVKPLQVGVNAIEVDVYLAGDT